MSAGAIRTWKVEAAANQEGYFFLPDEDGVNDVDGLDGVRVVALGPVLDLLERFYRAEFVPYGDQILDSAPERGAAEALLREHGRLSAS